ncbi:MAG: nucleotidyltransferase family protein [Pseudoflavonifractor sp.]|nr:nucleotidyltransferase family protein [Pseudoflavonifractor sp.]
MKAMIFAAGLGTRLRPLTDRMPKALVPVGGVPMLERVMRRLIEAGADDVTVNVHHFAPMIADYIRSRDSFGIKVNISDESGLLLDTGGGILNARRWLDGDEPFIVHNADILTDIDLRAMFDAHLRSGAEATLLVGERVTSRYLLTDRGGRLRGWTNVSTGEVRPEGFVPAEGTGRVAFGGVHVVSPSLFDAMATFAPGPRFPIIPFYLSVCDSRVIGTYRPDVPYSWHDIGKPESLAAAERAMAGM